MTEDELRAFVRESNLIEGIDREPSETEIGATGEFLSFKALHVHHLEKLVHYFQLGARLRNQPGLNVRVGNHIPPDGGPDVEDALREILHNAASRLFSPYTVHHQYEALHPFTDGNGRSGRALWLWMMGGQAPLGFLHHFYYQALEAGR